jgi:hypothetical protein
MPSYPMPDQNPVCECRGNPMRAMCCPVGHMLECHYPYSCDQAGCAHLRKYDFEHDELLEMERDARRRLKAGQLAPYSLAENGAVTVRDLHGEQVPPLLDGNVVWDPARQAYVVRESAD